MTTSLDASLTSIDSNMYSREERCGNISVSVTENDIVDLGRRSICIEFGRPKRDYIQWVDRLAQRPSLPYPEMNILPTERPVPGVALLVIGRGLMIIETSELHWLPSASTLQLADVPSGAH